MSLCACTNCRTIVDTDAEPEAFWDTSLGVPELAGALCSDCRDTVFDIFESDFSETEEFEP